MAKPKFTISPDHPDHRVLKFKRIEAATSRVNAEPYRSYPFRYSLGHVTSEPGGSQSLDDLLGQADKVMCQVNSTNAPPEPTISDAELTPSTPQPDNRFHQIAALPAELLGPGDQVVVSVDVLDRPHGCVWGTPGRSLCQVQVAHELASNGGAMAYARGPHRFADLPPAMQDCQRSGGPDGSSPNHAVSATRWPVFLRGGGHRRHWKAHRQTRPHRRVHPSHLSAIGMKAQRRYWIDIVE